MRYLLFLLAAAAFGQSNWREPFPAHRIIGPVYYVGTADLACFLITSPSGHILINTGIGGFRSADPQEHRVARVQALGYSDPAYQSSSLRSCCRDGGNEETHRRQVNGHRRR